MHDSLPTQIITQFHLAAEGGISVQQPVLTPMRPGHFTMADALFPAVCYVCFSWSFIETQSVFRNQNQMGSHFIETPSPLVTFPIFPTLKSLKNNRLKKKGLMVRLWVRSSIDRRRADDEIGDETDSLARLRVY